MAIVIEERRSMLTSPVVSTFTCIASHQGAGNAGAPEMDPMDEGHEDEDEEKGDEDDEEGHEKEEEKRKVDDAAEPPAFGVQGEGGDSSVLEAVQDEVR